MLTVVRKVYTNRIDRQLISCVLNDFGKEKEVDASYLMAHIHKFDNATGVYVKNKFYIRRKANYPEIPEVFLEDTSFTKLWHGSADANFKPQYGKGRVDNDYGRGLYTTQDAELAKEWVFFTHFCRLVA